MFLHTNNEQSEKEIKKATAFTIALKQIKYPNLVKNVYSEKYKIQLKEIKDTNKWKDTLYELLPMTSGYYCSAQLWNTFITTESTKKQSW